MSALPPEVVQVIEAGEGPRSRHALHEMIRLGLTWDDVIEVARTAATWKREKDEQQMAVDGWKDSVTGRDSRGRPMYLCGKRLYYEGELRWFVITFHEDETV